jgi:hypothetical protein
MEELDNFKKLFWDAFHRPKLETEKFSLLFNQLEHLNDHVAGPFYSLYSNHNCDYVFIDKKRFPGINDADDFLDYCTSTIEKYYNAVSEVTAETDSEKKDKQVLLYQVDIKMELAQLAYEILKKQFNQPDKE